MMRMLLLLHHPSLHRLFLPLLYLLHLLSSHLPLHLLLLCLLQLLLSLYNPSLWLPPLCYLLLSLQNLLWDRLHWMLPS